MAEKTSATNGAPSNGGQSNRFMDKLSDPAFKGDHKRVDLSSTLGVTDPETQSAIGKWARKKSSLSKTPSDHFRKIFGAKPMSQEQILRQSINTTAHFAPQSVLGLLQKKIKGADTRIVSRKNAIQDLRVAIKSGVIEKKGKPVEITPAEKKSLQQKKLQAEAELIKAKQDKALFRQYLAEAIAKNAAPMREDIKSVRESAHIRRLTPSISQQIIDYVEKHRDVKDELVVIRKDTPAERVPNAFMEIVKKANEKSFDLLQGKPKLATQVRQRVFEQIIK